MIKFKSGDRDRLKQIQKLLEKADCLYNDLHNDTKEIKIEKLILDKFEDLRHELDGTYDEMEQASISADFIPLDKVYDRIKDIETLELEIIFKEEKGCKIYNVHADENAYYVEEYDGFAEDELELEEFMETAKLRNVTDEVDVIDLLFKAFEAEEEGKAKIN